MAKGKTYEEFIAKFQKPAKKGHKMTTDDCYTPPAIYEIVLKWAHQHLPIECREVVRPFYPGGDYQNYDYHENCVVIDNPPFSIFKQICNWFNEHGISFLLFAPGMTSILTRVTFIGTNTSIVYENGAIVNTSFVTNLMGDTLATSAPDLCRELIEAKRRYHCKKGMKAKKLYFPPNVLRATTLGTLSRHGVLYSVSATDGEIFRDAVRITGNVWGNSILLSDKAAAEKYDAVKQADYNKEKGEVAAAKMLELTEEAKKIIERLNQNK